MDEYTFVEVYRAKNTLQAALLQQALEEAGIRAIVENELLRFGDLMTDWATGPRITVEGRDVTRAVKVLARWEQADSTALPGSDEGSDVTNCMACGARMPDKEWECPACGWSYKGGEPEEEGRGDTRR